MKQTHFRVELTEGYDFFDVLAFNRKQAEILAQAEQIKRGPDETVKEKS